MDNIGVVVRQMSEPEHERWADGNGGCPLSLPLKVPLWVTACWLLAEINCYACFGGFH